MSNYPSNPDNTTELQTEQIFVDRGISVTIHQPWLLGPTLVGKFEYDHGTEMVTVPIKRVIAPNNGMITSYVTYADSSNRWLSGIRDDDNVPSSALNWIRSGSYGDQGSAANNDYLVTSGAYEKGTSNPYDPDEAFESVAEGTWAPLLLTNVSRNSGQFVPGPLYEGNISRVDSIFRRLGSIDIVLTSDKSKWTRCPVFEMGLDENLTEGNAPSFRLRRAPSIDKDGNPCASMTMGASNNPEDPNYIAANGMGWFPGYAIDIETGARLNMCYGEDSYYPELNGRDMMFNPPALKETTVMSAPISQLSDPVLFDPIDNTAVMGGKHFVYIFPMNDAGLLGDNYKISFKSPAYDAGAYLYKTIEAIEKAPTSSLRTTFYKHFWGQPLWAGMPMPVEGKEWLQEGNPVTISVRIATPYRSGYGNFALENETELFDTINHKGYNPYYTFSTAGCGPVMNDLEKAEGDLEMVTVVPNPYYAFSTYEDNALTHKVKIANVPEKCVVTIYTVNGAKIRQFKKDSSVTSIDWDLTNFANTPIASGFYIIHVKDNTTGNETTVKFYAAMRQVDLNTF